MMGEKVFFPDARRNFLAELLNSLLGTDVNGIPSNADKHSKQSVGIAMGILKRLGDAVGPASGRLAGQRAGSKFEELCREYLEVSIQRLNHLRPGEWVVSKGVGGHSALAEFDQYRHLVALDNASRSNPELAAAIGSDYLIKPDVVVIRRPVSDQTINVKEMLVDSSHARLTPLRRVNSELPILHASVSCKWTLRSDRAQNARSEALNLIRNRKGRLPHIAVVTGEPTPNRIASIALGTGDIDCVYHIALPELLAAVIELDLVDAKDSLDTMIEGRRLRDITDLPFDLAI